MISFFCNASITPTPPPFPAFDSSRYTYSCVPGMNPNTTPFDLRDDSMVAGNGVSHSFSSINNNPDGLRVDFRSNDGASILNISNLTNATLIGSTQNSFTVRMTTYKDIIYSFSIVNGLIYSSISGPIPIQKVLISNDNVQDGPDSVPTPITPTPIPVPVPFPPLDICDICQIPRIIITSLLIDTNVPNFTTLNFSVFDTHKYADFTGDSILICPNECIYQTDFVKYPQFQTVIKPCRCHNNKHETLTEKVQCLIDEFDIDLDLDDFLSLLEFYASVRYILSGLLYKIFSVKWLEEQYYCQFLKDLANSKYYRFLIIFTNDEPEINFIGYEKYFIYGSECDFINKCHKNIGNTQKCKLQIQSRRT